MRQPMAALSDYDSARYQRQMMIEGWGDEGQARLRSASVFIAGAGGLGSPVATYLAVAGVGEIHICDADRVELSNLNRQTLHSDSRIGEMKALSAERTLKELNPTIKVVAHCERLDADNVGRIVGSPDIVVGCLDNFETRFVLSSYCITRRIPFVHGAVSGMLGQATFLNPPETPCLRCIVPQVPPLGIPPVVGAIAGLIGTIQALEVLKYLTGVGTPLAGRLLIVDGGAMSFDEVVVGRLDSCPDCSGTGTAGGTPAGIISNL